MSILEDHIFELNKQLIEAARNDEVDRVKRLIKNGADVNAKDYNQWTPLHYASCNGSITLVEMLLEKGADINSKKNDQRIPLHLAALKGNVELVILLLEKGADVHSKDERGQTPVDLSKKYNTDKNLISILEEHMRKSSENNQKNVPKDDKVILVDYAKEACYTEICKASLIKSAKEGNIKIVEIALKENIDIKTKESALKLAAENKHYDICRYLIKTGTDPKCLDKAELVEILKAD